MSVTLDLQIASAWPHLPKTAELEDWASAALAGRRQDAELTIRLVDEAESAALNRAYRHKDGPTNVLSFPFEAPPGAAPTGLIGDLVICAPVVAREAADQGKAPEAHWAHMVVHGVLHLLGYDHLEEPEARAMEGLETVILGELGFPEPYE